MDIRKTLQDAAYVTVGFGVITFQQAQVRRREAKARVDAQRREARRFVESQAREALGRAVTVRTEVLQRVEPLVGQLQTVPERLVHVAQEGATRFQRPSTN
jgi:vacuolar-type H+-ATPase subunit E/Vma4